jgi:hypothetical protein
MSHYISTNSVYVEALQKDIQELKMQMNAVLLKLDIHLAYEPASPSRYIAIDNTQKSSKKGR